jgi:hypothetical protein
MTMYAEDIKKEKWWPSIVSGSGGGAFQTADRVVMRDYTDLDKRNRSVEVCVLPANPKWGPSRYAGELDADAHLIASAPVMFSALYDIANGSEPLAAKLASEVLDRARLCLVGPAMEDRQKFSAMFKASMTPTNSVK